MWNWCNGSLAINLKIKMIGQGVLGHQSKRKEKKRGREEKWDEVLTTPGLGKSEKVGKRDSLSG
jgi:DNA mismatch repair protein MutH